MISFVVPAYNEEALLGDALASIDEAMNSLDLPFEVIVADDASTDRTAEIAEEVGARVVRVDHRQISATRNSGARVAAGEWLIFVDADTKVNANVIQEAVSALESGVAGGGCTPNFEGPLPWFARMIIPPFTWLYGRAKLAGGCFVFCTREAFEAVGRFSEDVYAGEEVWLSLALRRHGRFVMLKSRVLTSGRKLRMYSGLYIWGIFFGVALKGPWAGRTRKGLGAWYDGRREDPRTEK